MDPSERDRVTTLVTELYVELVEKLMRSGVPETAARSDAMDAAVRLAMLNMKLREDWED